MDATTIIIIVLLVTITLWWVLKPLWTETVSVNSLDSQHNITELFYQRDTIYKTIKALDLDFESNKVSEDNHRKIRLKLMHRAAHVLQKIDNISQQTDHALETKIDTLLKRFPKTKSANDRTLLKMVRGELEHVVTSPTQLASTSKKTKTDSRFCTKCGHATDVNDVFCAKCGTRLKSTTKP
ncbi:MAG: hypothetical protein B6242_08205 [Anaerolineaceae bacterium 4572_78]|nr:MAG: hypothetical protein B6242_08205 [Anaerolineaceae bacterium 4572_78]